MFLPYDLLRREAEALGIALTDSQLAQLDCYGTFLVDYNEKVNLTAITDPEGVAVKHFLDSLLLLRAVDLPQGATLADVGTGAGFPSVPCKVLRPDLDLTLLDSLGKRITFLGLLSEKLGQQNTCVHIRAEEAGQRPAFREHFDCATARAVADLKVLAEYCLPLVKVGGTFAALKGYDCEEELAQAEAAIALLGGKVDRVEKFLLPGENRRAIICIKKISQTPTKYPRPAAKMAKNPL